MGNNSNQNQTKRFVDYWTFKNAYDEIINLIKSLRTNTLNVNTINESTSDSGVTIDGVLLKDGYIDPKSINPITYHNIIATGTNAAGAKLLKYGYNQITTATSSEKCVALPTEITNQKLYINNYTSESIYIYGNQLEEFIIQDVTNNTPSTFSNITLNPGKSVELIRVGSVWLAISFSGVANKPLIYKAILTQTGSNDPVATVLNGNDANYLNIVWTRNGDGSYLGTYNGITNINTIPHVSGAFADTFGYDVKAISDAVWITQYDGAVATDGILYLYVTIEYYGV